MAAVATVRELVTSGAIETYADGYGVWHAHVPRTPVAALPDMTPERLARAAIRLELSDRGDITGYRLRVAREPIRTYAAVQSRRIHFREA